MVNTAHLTINSCYKISEVPPPHQDCGICMTPLISPEPTEHKTIVKTKVCDHYFHQDCLDAWFRSATPNLNVCPLDRLVLYGEARVPQTPVNVPGYVPFPGHNVDEHDAQPEPLFLHQFSVGLLIGDYNVQDIVTLGEIFNPGLTAFFSGDDAVQPSQGAADVQNAESFEHEDTESQSLDSPSLPFGFRTMPEHDEDPREVRRWGW